MRKFVRSLALVAALAAPLSIASAQSGFGVGSKLFSVGLLGGGASNYGIGAGAAFEVGVKDFTPELSLGIGGFVGFTHRSDSYFTTSISSTTIPIAAIGNVHYKLKDQPKLDLYGGLNLGFVHYSFSTDYPGYTAGSYGGGSSSLALGLDVGARYDFAPKVAGFVQLSGGSNFPLYFLGLTFKM